MAMPPVFERNATPHPSRHASSLSSGLFISGPRFDPLVEAAEYQLLFRTLYKGFYALAD